MPNKMKELGDMMTTLADASTKERQQAEAFKAVSPHAGFLQHLRMKMDDHVSDACSVYKERHGVEINKEQHCMLLGLPLFAKIAEKDAENDGMDCYVDKTYYILSEQFKKFGEN